MKVLVVGGGGREHAMAWALARSAQVSEVLVAPGNAGTAGEAKVRNVGIGAEDIPALAQLAREHEVAFTVVGPEAPLVAGIVDTFREAGLQCLGPTAAAAELEGSKAFAKGFMSRHGIPTAAYETFDDLEQARDYICQARAPLVVKADGLASGKGVEIAETLDHALLAAERMLSGEAFGEAGQRIVVEECLRGEELSFIAVVDGETVVSMASSQDHKPRDDGDRGPNTGGMGAYSPAPLMDEALHERVMREVLQPTVAGLAAEGRPYKGFLYAGLMIDEDGNPRVLEFNCRLGDPEAQPLLLRLCTDFAELCEAALEGRLQALDLAWEARPAVGVVMAAAGYPGAVERGRVIRGLAGPECEGVKVFHGGTALAADGAVVTNGGRVLCCCALGDSVTAAQRRAYERVAAIDWEGAFYRSDIAHHAIRREQQAGG
ncbi:phosphoribosylamine--glycine ligase [Halorhodospira abdelmalekii]|uniref:phosphoribosylamine--glycine ligase n=1 Tax=Halorhodospira abdelmalekii TaxID=421629 RepID=UPI0019075AB0|nr:phosphoribosylamine--glycine ligase [Halorhodospira abdelmalekii]MBK1734321.1 phosphoribosylamine--glycine ligase [Halorhodospira abdelmalekii]